MKPGTRVAVISADGKKFLGYGVYVGDEDCPVLRESIAKGARRQAEIYIELARKYESGEIEKLNPKIRLDSGKDAWGCECWWGDAGEFVKSGKAKEMRVGKAPARPWRHE